MSKRPGTAGPGKTQLLPLKAGDTIGEQRSGFLLRWKLRRTGRPSGYRLPATGHGLLPWRADVKTSDLRRKLSLFDFDLSP